MEPCIDYSQLDPAMQLAFWQHKPMLNSRNVLKVLLNINCFEPWKKKVLGQWASSPICSLPIHLESCYWFEKKKYQTLGLVQSPLKQRGILSQVWIKSWMSKCCWSGRIFQSNRNVCSMSSVHVLVFVYVHVRVHIYWMVEACVEFHIKLRVSNYFHTKK